jgi:hypothetical protein
LEKEDGRKFRFRQSAAENKNKYHDPGEKSHKNKLNNYQAAFPFLVIHAADNWQPSALPLLEKMQQRRPAPDSPPGINKQTECAARCVAPRHTNREY